MARKKLKDEFSNYFQPILVKTSDDLSKKYGGGSPSDYLKIFKQFLLEYFDLEVGTFSSQSKAEADIEFSRLKILYLEALYMQPIKDAFEVLGQKMAWKLMSGDVKKFRKYVTAYQVLSQTPLPLHTLHELRNLTDKFIPYLEKNRRFLFETGFPQSRFEGCFLLEGLLSHLHYVKVPLAISGDKTLTYTWPDHPAAGYPYEPYLSGKGYVYKKVNKGIKEIIIITKKTLGNPPKTAETSKTVKTTTYQESPYLGCISAKDARQIESLRSNLFVLTKLVLTTLSEALRKQNYDDLIESCFRHFSGVGVLDDIDFLLSYERAVSGFQFDSQIISSSRFRYPCGGIFSLWFLIAHVYAEIKVGAYNDAATYLGKVLPDCKGLEHESKLRPLFEALVSKNGKYLLPGLDALIDKWDAETNAWKEASERLYELFSKPAQLKDQISEACKGIIQSQMILTTSKRHIEAPQNASWTDLTLTIESKRKLLVKFKQRPKPQEFDPFEIGFKDRRTPHELKKSWTLLRAFAKGKGAIPFGIFPKKDVFKKKIESLNKTLKSIFHMPGNPIKYEEANISEGGNIRTSRYRILCNVLDHSGKSDDTDEAAELSTEDITEDNEVQEFDENTDESDTEDVETRY